MATNLSQGEIVHGELETAVTGTQVVLYKHDGSTRALGATERLVITDYRILCSGGANTVSLTNKATDAAGQRIARGAYVANGGEAASLATEYLCKPGVGVYVYISAATNVNVGFQGYIIRT